MGAFCSRTIATSLLLVVALPLSTGATASSPRWRVVVHPSNPARVLARSEVERIYRGRTVAWPDGRSIVALNLPGGDDLRSVFTREVLQSGVDELATYWNRQYFHGVEPPPVLQSTQSVCAFVAATPGAIGYVDSCENVASVAVVEVDLER
jgi:ABC-type phosphate transport system substrate-binding protein